MCTNKWVLLGVTVVCLFSIKVSAQLIPGPLYGAGSRQHQQIQRIIDHTISYSENMLAKQGAFAPYAAALTVTDSVVILDGYDNTKDKSLTGELDDLKSQLKAGADKDLYKAVVIYFDVTVTDPYSKLSTDAIAVFSEQVNTHGTHTFYFPYKKSETKGLSQSRSFGDDVTDNEIFIKVSKN
jgi:hypothetical protein